jgi:hypothetical protein
MCGPQPYLHRLVEIERAPHSRDDDDNQLAPEEPVADGRAAGRVEDAVLAVGARAVFEDLGHHGGEAAAGDDGHGRNDGAHHQPDQDVPLGVPVG